MQLVTCTMQFGVCMVSMDSIESIGHMDAACNIGVLYEEQGDL